LFLLNGGGTLALLTFLTQIIVGAPAAGALVKPIVLAITAYALGLFAAAPINHFRYETSRSYDRDETKSRGKKYGFVARTLFVMSLVLFAIGTAIAMIAVWQSSDFLLANIGVVPEATE
jgi:hypothetical protein